MNDDDRPVRQIFSAPTPPAPRNRAPSITIRVLTWAIMVFAAIWLAVTLATHVVPSKFTYISQLACLLFFAGEYVGWKGPRGRR